MVDLRDLKTFTYECWDCRKECLTYLGRIVHGFLRHRVRWATSAYYEDQFRADPERFYRDRGPG